VSVTSECGLCDIAPLEPGPCAVADVQYFDLLLLFQDAVDRAVNVWLVAVQQVPELLTLRRRRAPVRLLFEAEYRFLEAAIPFLGPRRNPRRSSARRGERGRARRGGLG